MRVSKRLLPLTLALLLLLAACGDDNGDTAGATDAGSAAVDQSDDGEWPPSELPGTGEAGSITVDGTEYGIDVLRLCDPDKFANTQDRITRLWEVQGAGASDSDDIWADDVEISVYTGEQERPNGDIKPYQGLKYNGPEGLYQYAYHGKEDGMYVEVRGERATAEMQLDSGMGNPPVDVSVDIAVPDSDPVDCS